MIASRPLGRNDLAQSGEVCGAVLDVVIRVDDQDEVDRFGKIGGVRARPHGLEHAQVLAMRPLAEVLQHLGLDIDGEHPSFRHPLGEAHAEISGAGAEIGDDSRGRELQRVQHLVGLLPGITVRIIELLWPTLPHSRTNDGRSPSDRSSDDCRRCRVASCGSAVACANDALSPARRSAKARTLNATARTIATSLWEGAAIVIAPLDNLRCRAQWAYHPDL